MLWRGVAAGISQTVQTTMVTRKAKSRLITWSSLYSTLEHFHRHATENEPARDAVRAGTLDIVGGSNWREALRGGRRHRLRGVRSYKCAERCHCRRIDPLGRRAGHRWDVGLMRILPDPRDGERRAVTSPERSRFAFARPARDLSRSAFGVTRRPCARRKRRPCG